MSPLPAQNSTSGVVLNVMASALFAALYAYTQLLHPLTGEVVYGWRMLLTVPCLSLYILASGRLHEVREILARVRQAWTFALQRVLSSFLLGIQLWVFMWAPLNGHGLDVSLGYFLLPISMVVVGRFALHERISPYQLTACALAFAGVGYQLAVTLSISWPTLLVCVGYPGYFWLRRVTHTNTLGSAWLDMTLSLPVCLFFVMRGGVDAAMLTSTSLPWLILGLGAISAAALGCQALSAPRITLALFGLLIYVEPVLLVIASLLMGERIPAQEWPMYIAIWLAVLVLIAEGVRAIRRRR